MSNLLKSALLGAGMLVALGAAASAQSVANLPPADTAAPPPPALGAPIASSTKGVQPEPGALGNWKSEHAQASTEPSSKPYSTPGFGPKPN
jgi:hypothetical protein